MRKLVTLAILVACGLVSLSVTATANAATAIEGKQKQRVLRAAVASPGGKSVSLKVNAKGRVTMAVLHPDSVGPATLVAMRSSVNRRWALLVALQYGDPMYRRAFLLKRTASRWKVVWSASRGSEIEEVCSRRQPGTAVILDLGLSDGGWDKRCRHQRKRSSLVSRMSGAEVNSIRRMVEWTWGANGLMPGPVQPRVSDKFASNCDWDGDGGLGNRPVGEIARSNPKWGLLSITCVIGSDGFAELASTTVMLVRRPSHSGPFTQALVHTGPSWSMRATLCDKNRSWPIPALPRVALEFCAPFPPRIKYALQ